VRGRSHHRRREVNQLDGQGKEPDGRAKEPVVIASQNSLNDNSPIRMPSIDISRDPVMKFVPISIAPHRIIGVTADIDDEHVVLALASLSQSFEEGPCSAAASSFHQRNILIHWSRR